MTTVELDRLRQDVVAVAGRTDFNRASLVPVLRAIKDKYRCIDSEAMQLIADVLGIHPVEVYSVATFYSFLHPEAEGQMVFRLCRTLSCQLEGKDAVAAQLQNELGVSFGETTPDQLFSLEWANCMGMCDQGPAMLVNDTVYTRLTPERVSEIIAEYRARQMDDAPAASAAASAGGPSGEVGQ
jgi:[NiFe] hydrogenase diaphorase moiety large subunit